MITPPYWVNDTCDAFQDIAASIQKMPNMTTVSNAPACYEKPANPYFSIIVPAYNQKNCIRRAISSVRNQDFADFELILVNDGSTDNTASVLQEYAELNKKITVVTHLKNESLHIARLDGVAVSNGRYVVFLDGDDYFCENAIAILYEEIQKNPGYDLYEFGYREQPSGRAGFFRFGQEMINFQRISRVEIFRTGLFGIKCLTLNC